MYPGLFRHIRLLALDPCDLVLTKLTRNADRDRGDVEYLATAVPLDVSVLRERYHRLHHLIALPIGVSNFGRARLQHVSKVFDDSPLIEQPNRPGRRRRAQVHVPLGGAEILVPRQFLNRPSRRTPHRQTR